MTTLKNSSKTRISTIALFTLMAVAGSAAASDVIHLQSLGGDYAIANDINDQGDVVGQSAMAGGLGVVATRWDATHMPANLGMLSGNVLSEAYAINNNGEIVGFSEDAGVFRSATLWDGRGGIVDVHTAIGSTGASIPWDINDNGVITGQAPLSPGFSKGFVWDQVNPAMVAGTTPGFMGGANYGINNAGVLVGSAFFFGDPDDATMASPDGRGGYEYRDIAPIGLEFSVATQINNNGMVVGHTTFGSTTSGWNAVIYTPDERDPVQVLGTLPGLDTSESLDVNDNGMVVGYAWDGQGNGLANRAWVWVDGQMYDLNDSLGDQPAFEILFRATGVNNNGDIVGYGKLHDGNTGAFLIEGFTAPAECVADMNNDGELNFFDVSAFLEAFSRLDPIADMNGDRDYNFFDVSDFLSAFGAGCP